MLKNLVLRELKYTLRLLQFPSELRAMDRGHYQNKMYT